MTKSIHILSIGCGNMGAAILSGLITGQPGVRVTAIDPDPDRARRLLPRGADVTIHDTLIPGTQPTPDVTLLAVKPQQFHVIARDSALRAAVADGLTVSIMAGVSVATICDTLQTKRVARVMPNLPALVGAAMSTGYASASLSQIDRDRTAAIFETVGDFLWLAEEHQIDAATAVAGSGPGYVFAFAEHLEKAAVAQGLGAAEARRLVRGTLAGAARMLAGDARTAAELKSAVTSKGGTTEAGLAVLEARAALPELVPQAVRAAERRARQLSGQQ